MANEPSDTQDAPLLAQNEASEDDKVTGIVKQTRADLATAGPQKLHDLLIDRLRDAGIERSPEEIENLLQRVLGTD